MAGGPSSPELVAAVSEAGGLGMLPAGSISAVAFADALQRTRELTDQPFGVNLFVPRQANPHEHQLVDHAARSSAVGAYAAELVAIDEPHVGIGEAAETSGVSGTVATPGEPAAPERIELGTPDPDFDEDWDAKIDLLEREPVEIVTFTFGLPRASVIERLNRVGTACGVMVTKDRDALDAVEAGASVVIAQGFEAGGHRSTWAVAEPPNRLDTATVVRECRDAVRDRAVVVAAGGIDSHEAYLAAIAAGADLVQVGTALLLADEAGTKPTVRRALVDPAFTETIATRAFSGRVARALRNGFAARHDAIAPAAYPDVNQLTAPLRARAEREGDVHGVSAYAGINWRTARAEPAASILHRIVGR